MNQKNPILLHLKNYLSFFNIFKELGSKGVKIILCFQVQEDFELIINYFLGFSQCCL